MTRSSIIIAGGVFVAAVTRTPQAEGHLMQKYPMSRQLSYGPDFRAWDDPLVEFCPHCYNARGPKFVEERSKSNTAQDTLDKFGGGEEFPLYFGEYADNGNYLETDEIAVRHGICGDPEQNADEGSNRYSTPNINWDVIDSFTSGQVLEMDVVMNAYHWGHCEFFVCNTDTMEDPDGLPTQECFNQYPLTRAPDDGDASPIDPAYPGRYYVDPECRAGETEQGSNSVKGYNIRMRYVLPDIQCDHCILQMVYYTGNTCKHIGYDEFNPPSWPSSCAPNKSDWIELDRYVCGTESQYPEQFWACSDFSLTSGGSVPAPTPATTVEPEPATQEPVSAATDDSTSPTYYSSTDDGTTASDDDTATPSSDDDTTTASSDDTTTTTEDDEGADAFEADDDDDNTMVMYEYIGCYSDKQEDRILGDMKTSDSMTADLCYEHCSGAGAKYMATQFGSECFCSISEELDFERHGDGGVCDYHCVGDARELCGGFDSFSLYELIPDMNVNPPTTEECSGDPVVAYEQCGGDSWTGSTCCSDGHECTKMGDGTCYSQCRPST